MDAPPTVSRTKWWKYPVAAFAVLAPLALVWELDVAMAGGEYELSTWFIGYHGEHLRAHGTFPGAYQTADRVGAPAPVFYGHVLYKVAGLLSLIDGPHRALRLVVALCLACSYFTVRRALRKFRATEGLATATACAVCWAVYALTNLYNRGAFAEFVAASCLTCSCCLWAEFFLRPRRRTGWGTALAAGFFLTCAAGTHPITGMLSIPFLATVYMLQWVVPVPERPGVVRRHAALLAAAGLSALVLSPWLYAYHHLGHELGINVAFTPGLSYREGGLLSAVCLRLSPVPADYRLLHPDAPPIGVEHLDAQLNLSLLVVAAVLAAGAAGGRARGGRWRLAGALAPAAALGLAAFVISVYRDGFANEGGMEFPNAPSFLWKTQFSYRLVAVINLALLLVAVTALAYRRAAAGALAPPRVGLAPLALGIAATIAVTGLLTKLAHGRASLGTHRLPLRADDPGYEQWLVSHRFPASRDYVTVAGVEAVPELPPGGVVRGRFEVGTGAAFGRTRPLHVEAPTTGFVVTQALPFRWNQFRVDGHVVPPEYLRVFYDAPANHPPHVEYARAAVPVAAGPHTIEYQFQPPRNWVRLTRLSESVFVIWLAALAAAAAAGRVRQRSAPRASAPAPTPAVTCESSLARAA